MKTRTYGYCRISTMKQSIKRQISNIRELYPDAVIIEEQFTGTKINRPAFDKLLKSLKKGDTLIFDEVSRMSRNAEEGFATYKELYDRGINLIFIKESMLNTDVFRTTQQIATVGNEIADMYIDTTNKVLMLLAENQIKKAFETAEHEVDFLHKRTREGIAIARANGKQIGRAAGAKIETKKSKECKARIMELSKDFNGSNTDVEVMAILGIARNTYYKYKSQMKA